MPDVQTMIMVRLSVTKRKRVIILWQHEHSLRDIQRQLKEEEITITLRSIQHLCAKFSKFHTIRDLTRAHKTRLLTTDMMKMVDESLQSNNKLTSKKLKTKLSEKFPSIQGVSLATIKHCRKQLGWVSTRPHYCQLLREGNKQKRKEWCQRQLDRKETFDDVIFKDQCSVQLEQHGRLRFRKEKEPRALKHCSKHPVKVHL